MQAKRRLDDHIMIDSEISAKIILIIEEIRKIQQRLSLKNAIKLFPKLDFGRLCAAIESHSKLRFNKLDECFELKSVYNIKNQTELYNYILESYCGVPEDNELFDCYPGCKEDLELMKARGMVISLESNEKKLNVLFGIDRHDPVQKEYEELNKDALEALREIWDNEVKNVSENERRTMLEKEGMKVQRKVATNKATKPDEKRVAKHKKTRDNLLG
eukprot:TRINITY_DN4649_c0_g2_i1.p1 TRINITY_DN4649_c0_g2~~TRINITY_DN4649_c0_g2_i1.p1  ORF type:complete len:248 (+),score=98.01 TRINITY_DN4649_c0_g2_i1:98-745(+)